MMEMMNAYEIEEYAKKSDMFDSLPFLMFVKQRPFNGRFLDAYYGMVQIPELGDGFVLLNQLIKEIGFENLKFLPLTK